MADNNLLDNSAQATQRVITAGPGTQIFSNSPTDNSFSLDASDTSDFYRLQVTRRSRLILTLNSESDNADLALLDGSPANTVIKASTNANTMTDAIVTDILEPGTTYYIRTSLGANATATNYTLTANTIGTIRADLAWRYSAPNAGNLALWQMDGANIATSSLISPPVEDTTWSLETTADMNSDGIEDFIWRNYRTGDNAIWFMDGNNTIAGGSGFNRVADRDWKIVGAGDFNGDTKQDLVWQYTPTGQTALWYMDGATFLSSTLLVETSDRNWQVQAVADFIGVEGVPDGKPDFIWRNVVTGQNAIWVMDNTSIVASASLETIPVQQGWQIQGVGDFNADGKPDLLWRDGVYGVMGAWLMDGTVRTTTASLYTVGDFNWQVASIIKTPQVVDLAGNSLAGALNAGRASGSATYQDKIGGPADPLDYYRFNLTETGRLNLTLTGQGTDLRIVEDTNRNNVFDASDLVIPSTVGTAANTKQISGLELAAGNYFIEVSSTATLPSANPIDYALAFETTLLLPSDLTPTVFNLTTSDGQPLPFSIDISNPYQLQANYRIQNSGSPTASTFSVAFYISRDNVIDTTDTLLTTRDGVIVPGNSLSDLLSQSLTLPAGSDPFWNGDQVYYIGIIVDSANQVRETDETNNTTRAPINVQRTTRTDLVAGVLNVVQASAGPGQTLTLQGRIDNVGGGTVPANSSFRVQFFLSKDNLFQSGSDYRLSPVSTGYTIPVGAAGIPTNGNVTFDFTSRAIPTVEQWDGWQGSGTYYVVMRLDTSNLAGEVVENNENFGGYFDPISIAL